MKLTLRNSIRLFFTSLGYLALVILNTSWSASHADISAQFRQTNAVVLYEFKETSGTIINDTASPSWGPAAPLEILEGDVRRISGGGIEIKSPSQIRTQAPPQKIHNACRSKNEVSVELLIQNADPVQERVGVDDAMTRHPLRIVTYSKGLKSRNFTIGQSYDGGELYAAGVTNQSNEGLSLREPLMSTSEATFAPPKGPASLQKLIFTFKNGQARMYLSDREGQIYLHRSASADFTGDLTNWDPTAHLVLGNEYITNSAVYGYGTNFGSCNPATDRTCATNPNRFWKGRVQLLAIYCRELTKAEIFGTGLEIVTNQPLAVNMSVQITPQLKRAQTIYSRLSGVSTPIYNPELSDMVTKLNLNDAVGAAAVATGNPNFLNITVRDFASKMSNREETNMTPLNDFVATVVGFVRDGTDARRLLFDNVVYQGDPALAAVPSNLEMDMIKSNNHYEALSNDRYDLGKVLIKKTQKIWNGTAVVDNPTPAGLLTTRQWMAAHAIAGTNRRLVEYSLREFLGMPLEKVADATGPDNVVARDIDRFPGGSHTKYVTNCRACHTIMDGMRPAFAHFTFSNNMIKHGLLADQAADADEEATTAKIELITTPTKIPYIPKKINHNETVFPEGRVTTTDEWVNNAIFGTNATTFAWDRTSGRGIDQFGQMLANSKQFQINMAKRVFASVCRREPGTLDMTMINQVAGEFAATQNYNLRWLFQKIVTTDECIGGAN